MRFKVDYYTNYVVVIDRFRAYKEYVMELNGRDPNELAFECIKNIYLEQYKEMPTLANELIEKAKKDLGV